jgi:tocopherol O-methyltransferase
MLPRLNAQHRRIVDYFELCQVDYRLVWNLGRSMAMHMGYWDETTRTFPQALARENEVLAAKAGVQPGDRVLDAGSGVGGSAIYLAKTLGCRVWGVTLSARQVESARRNARRHGVADLTRFSVMDFSHTSFGAQSFDVVWAVESMCYAQRKGDFVREMHRLLKPGGRLVVADGFAVASAYRGRDARIMRRWLDAWGIEELATRSDFERHLHSSGFSDVGFEDATRNVQPSSRRLYLHSLYGLPLSKVGELFGLRRPIQTQNVIGSLYLYRARMRDLARYLIALARKN